MDLSVLTIDRVIALVASIGTFITAILVLFSLMEMRRQRRSAYFPEFVINDDFIDFFIIVDSKESPPRFEWKSTANLISHDLDLEKDNNESSIDDIFENLRPHIKISCHNIGLGPAKNVTIFWDFDPYHFKSLIHNKNDDLSNDISKDRYAVHINGLKQAWLIPRDWSLPIKYSYILPYTLSVDATEIFLPESYIILLSLHLFNLINYDVKYSSANIPKLTMRIKYFDIENNALEKKIRILFYISSAGLEKVNRTTTKISFKIVAEKV